MKAKYQRYPLLFFFVCIGIFEFLYFFPKRLFVLESVAATLVLVSVWRINVLPIKEKFFSASYWHFSLPLLFFVVNSILFSIVLERQLYFHVLALFTAFFSFLYLKYIVIYFRLPLFNDEKALPNISFFLNTSTVFFLSDSLLAFILLLNLDVVLSFLIFLAELWLLSFQTLWVSRINPIKATVYALVITIIFAELFWVFRFLPLDYTIVALIMAGFFHLLLNLSVFWIQDLWEFKLVRKYIIIGLVLLFVVLGTAQWK
ncbi:MAG TPA: hypothetical protein VJA22_00825 [Patescibacteria group bacterium]|nr:hypothetical protein [Patescibacteria group bacterium]